MKTMGIFVLIVILVAFSPYLHPPADPLADFYIFRRAGVALLQGQSPYTDPLYFSPLYVAALFIPYALLTPDLAYRVNMVVSLTLLFMISWRYTRRIDIALMLLYARPLIYIWHWGNIDYLPLLGGLVNPLLGIWLALSKPQVGFLLFAYLTIHLAKKYGLRSIPYALLPLLFVALAYLNSDWRSLQNVYWNVSIFPISLVAAIPLLAGAILFRDKLSALSAATFATPYLGLGSYSAILIWAGRNINGWLVLLFVVASLVGYQ